MITDPGEKPPFYNKKENPVVLTYNEPEVLNDNIQCKRLRISKDDDLLDNPIASDNRQHEHENASWLDKISSSLPEVTLSPMDYQGECVVVATLKPSDGRNRGLMS